MNINSRHILDEVKENHRKLDSCICHNFGIDMMSDRIIGKKYKCTQCGGVIDAINKIWYERGLKHGGGNSNGI